MKPSGRICVYAHGGFAAPRMLGNIVRTVKVEERREYPAAVHNAKESNNIENDSASTELFKFVLPTKPQRATGELVRSIKGGIWKAAWAVCRVSERARQRNSEPSQMTGGF